MPTLPQDLPCLTTAEEYGPTAHLREQYGAFRGRFSVPMTPEQQADHDRRMKRLDERLAEIEAEMMKF